MSEKENKFKGNPIQAIDSVADEVGHLTFLGTLVASAFVISRTLGSGSYAEVIPSYLSNLLNYAMIFSLLVLWFVISYVILISVTARVKHDPRSDINWSQVSFDIMVCLATLVFYIGMLLSFRQFAPDWLLVYPSLVRDFIFSFAAALGVVLGALAIFYIMILIKVEIGFVTYVVFLSRCALSLLQCGVLFVMSIKVRYPLMRNIATGSPQVILITRARG